jgi:hypothetical protein
MRAFAGMFVGGIAAIVLLKLVFGLILPLIGIVVGFVALAIKLALVVAVGYFVYTLVRGRKHEQTVA